MASESFIVYIDYFYGNVHYRYDSPNIGIFQNKRRQPASIRNTSWGIVTFGNYIPHEEPPSLSYAWDQIL